MLLGRCSGESFWKGLTHKFAHIIKCANVLQMETAVLAKYFSVGRDWFALLLKHNITTDGTRLSYKDLQCYLWLARNCMTNQMKAFWGPHKVTSDTKDGVL